MILFLPYKYTSMLLIYKPVKKEHENGLERDLCDIPKWVLNEK